MWAGTFPRILSKEAIVMKAEDIKPSTRWSVFPPLALIQLPLGSIYAWSMWQAPLTTQFGVVTSAALDWSLGSTAVTFSCLATGYAVGTGLLGPWVERAGPRYVSLVSGIMFGSGHLLSALGCYLHSLPLVWSGWGLMCGCGWGMGFIAPISTLLRWFPDKKGLATGACIGVFGGGALFAAPLTAKLQSLFFKPPVYVGSVDKVSMKTDAAVQYVQYQGAWHEAVVATAGDLAKLPGDWPSKLLEGVYLVGTGDNGNLMAFATLGVAYTCSQAIGAFMLRAPPPGWTPPGWTPPVSAAASGGSALIDGVSAKVSLKTPQFYLLWLMVACNCSAGVAVIANAKLMMAEIMSAAYPTMVTAASCTAYVGALSVANAGGRLGWAAVSDFLGRRSTYFICSLSIPACILIPQLSAMAAAGSAGAMPLYLFYGTTFMMVTWYGGVLAMIPAYSADLFGQKEVGVIYGRMVTAWAFSAIVSPSLLTALRGRSVQQAIDDLVAITPPETFEKAFGAPTSDLASLVASNTVNIARLMDIAPQGTVDPTPFLYDSTFYTLGGILSVAAVGNALIRKVDQKYLDLTAKEEAEILEQMNKSKGQ